MMRVISPALMVMTMVIAGELDLALVRARGALLIERAQEFAGLVDRLDQPGIGIGTERVEGHGDRHGLG